MRKITIKARLKRGVGLAAKMPFPKVCRCISCVVQNLSKHGKIWIKTCRTLDVRTFLIWQRSLTHCCLKLFIRKVRCRCSHPMPSRILPGHDAGTRRGTYRTGVGIRKRHAACSEAFDIGCFIERCLSVERCVCPTQIICQYQHNISDWIVSSHCLACGDCSKQTQKTKQEAIPHHSVTSPLSTVQKNYHTAITICTNVFHYISH